MRKLPVSSLATPGLLVALLTAGSVCPPTARAANVAHQGFPDPLFMNTLLLASGHRNIQLTAAQVEAGMLVTSGADVFLLGRGTATTGASQGYVDGVLQFLNAGGGVVAEFSGAGIFFDAYAPDITPLTVANTPQLGLFQGTVHAGGLHRRDTPIYKVDLTHPVVAGLPNPFFEFDGNDRFFWVETNDSSLSVVGEFDGNGAPGFPVGSHPCLLVGCWSGAPVVMGSWDWADSIVYNGLNRRMMMNAIGFANTRCNTPPQCSLAGPYTAECTGPLGLFNLDASGSNDPDGDVLTFEWSTDCPMASFDDPSSPTPTLSMDMTTSCSLSCAVTVTVRDGRASATCSTTLSVADSTMPVLTVSVTPLSSPWEFMVEASAVDGCKSVSVSASVDTGCEQIPVVDGQAVALSCDNFACFPEEAKLGPMPARLLVAAVDACGNTSTATVDFMVGDGCGPKGPPPGPPPVEFLRGDVDGDEHINLRDVVRLLLLHTRYGEPVTCMDAADVNDDGSVSLHDAIHLVLFLFHGFPPVSPPFPERGVDETEDDLGCEAYPAPEQVERYRLSRNHCKARWHSKKCCRR